MHCFEFTCKTYIKKSFSFLESFEIISKFISFSFAVDDDFLKLHSQNRFKTYNFASFVECDKKKPPKKIEAGTLLCFSIRTIDKEFALKLPKLLEQNTNNPYMSVVSVAKKMLKPFFISELYTLTPTITIYDSKFWSLNNGDIMLLQRLLHDNLAKKYKQFYGEITPFQNFIQLLEIKNKTPQFLTIHKNNKTVKLLGNKFKIVPNEDETSQKLAFLALGVGLGEKNTLGGGFCVYKGVR